MVVFLSINLVATPPRVSIPSDSGVTSSNKTSFTSPPKIPACIAAPNATASSGLTLLSPSLLVRSFTSACTDGILVDPPTSNTLSTSFTPESFSACSVGPFSLSKMSDINSSNLALVRSTFKCFGPFASDVTKGMFIVVC